MYGTYLRLNLHVGASARDCIRAAKKKLAPAAFRREHRKARHHFYRQMLQYHCEAQELFHYYRF